MEKGRRGESLPCTWGGGHQERKGLQGLQKGLEGSERPEAGQPWRIVGIAGASLGSGFIGVMDYKSESPMRPPKVSMLLRM